MSNEEYSWRSVTYYVDTETEEQIDKSEIGLNYTRKGVIDSKVKIDKENYTKTILRTIEVSKIINKQLELWK